MTVREALQAIADDMKSGTGNQAAAIATMADIMSALLPPDPEVVTCNGCRQQVRLNAEGTLPLHPINPLLRPSPWCKSRTDFTLAFTAAELAPIHPDAIAAEVRS